MEDQNSDYGPMSMHCPEGGSWCSLDAPVVATNCEDAKLDQFMGFWFEKIGNETCEYVNYPPVNRTGANSG